MRWYAWALMLVGAATIGCNQPVETIPAVSPSGSSSGATADGDHAGHSHAEGEAHDEAAEPAATGEPSAAIGQPEVIRFVADKRISVPEMMCPYSCWPKVKETLAAQPGVEAVQLADQPAGTAEGEINERVVELKINDDFDTDAAIAALSKVSFKAEIAQ